METKESGRVAGSRWLRLCRPGPPALLEIPVPLSRRSREGNGLCKGREEVAGKGDQVQ